MKKIVFDDPLARKNIGVTNMNETEQTELLSAQLQKNYIHNLRFGIDFSFNKIISQEIRRKLSSYKSQDRRKGKYDPEQHITYEDLVEMLYDSKLQCYYCRRDVYLTYRNKGEKAQWSLERFDNNIGHYKTNTCISCLQCNLQRRTDNHEYFKFSKNMSVKKVEPDMQ